ncbi:MAG: DUF805 domain-containing protein [Pseudomonadota bacterium]
MTQAVVRCLSKYATFSGRAPRAEYWYFALFCVLISLVLGLVETTINAITGTADGPTLLSGAFAFVTLVPSLAAGWRRMHDTGRSGLSLFYPLIVLIGIMTYIAIVIGPEALSAGEIQATGLNALILTLAFFVALISPILVIWWLTRPSEPGPNQYGPNPYEVTL